MLNTVPVREKEAIEALSARHAEPPWLREDRLKAWRLYEDMLPPTGREEEWRRTDLNALSVENIRLFDAAPIVAPRASKHEGYAGEIEQENGASQRCSLAPELTSQGIVFTDLHSAVRDHADLMRAHFMTEAVKPIAWKLVALHAALWQGGVFLYVPAGVEATVPLHAAVALAGDANALFPHTLVVAEVGSSVTLIEEQSSEGDGHALSSGVVELLVRDGAQVRYLSVQDWGDNVNSFSTVRAILGTDSSLELGLVVTGGRVVKGNIDVMLSSPGASAQIVGLVLGAGAQHMSFATLQDHRARDTRSDLLLKSALRDSAQLVWNGRTHIHKGAGESDANQSSQNLLLGEDAWVAPIPVLEIEAHDVARCSHGATVSSVDEEQLYYMMSRGLTRPDATQTIVDGFLRQGFERLSTVRDYPDVRHRLERRLLSEVA